MNIPVRKLRPLQEVLDVGLPLKAAGVLEPLRVHEMVQGRLRHDVEPAEQMLFDAVPLLDQLHILLSSRHCGCTQWRSVACGTMSNLQSYCKIYVYSAHERIQMIFTKASAPAGARSSQPLPARCRTCRAYEVDLAHRSSQIQSFLLRSRDAAGPGGSLTKCQSLGGQATDLGAQDGQLGHGI